MYEKCMDGLSSESALDRMDGRPHIHRMYSNRIFFSYLVPLQFYSLPNFTFESPSSLCFEFRFTNTRSIVQFPTHFV
jgi:hypothetical protein